MIIVLPVLSAILGILAFLPANLWFFGFLFLVPLFIFFLKEKLLWRLILGAFIFRFILMLGAVYYTLEPLAWLSSIGIFLGLPISIFIFKKVLKYLQTRQFVSLLVLLPFLWTVFDYLTARYSLLPGYIITTGNIFGSSPFLGLSAIGGLTLLTFFAALVNMLITSIFNFRKSDFRKITVIVIIIIIMLISAWQISNYQIQKNAENYSNLENSFNIASISTNENFNWLSFNKIKDKLTDKDINLIIFPENIFNNAVNNKKVYQDLAKKLNTNLIATFSTIQNTKKYNSSILFDKNGKIIDIYNKNHLTFIGEYWPFGNWHPFFFNWLKKNNPSIKNYAVFNPQSQYYKGEKKILTMKQFNNETILFASLICLEIHYPSDIKKYKKMGAQFIINPTSNRWIYIGTRHFLYLNNNLRKIKATQLKIPIILAGIKDFAGIITPSGEIKFVDFADQNKNYEIFLGKIKY